MHAVKTPNTFSLIASGTTINDNMFSGKPLAPLFSEINNGISSDTVSIINFSMALSVSAELLILSGIDIAAVTSNGLFTASLIT